MNRIAAHPGHRLVIIRGHDAEHKNINDPSPHKRKRGCRGGRVGRSKQPPAASGRVRTTVRGL